MEWNTAFAIELLYGPLDGDKHVTHLDPGDWASVLVIPFGALQQEQATELRNVQQGSLNFAVYELAEVGGSLVYKHIASLFKGSCKSDEILACWKTSRG